MGGHTRHFHCTKERRGRVLAFLLTWMIGLTYLAIDPFGLHESTVRDSARIFHELTASSYPFLWRQPGAPARDSISVILVDDASLQRRHYSWPVSHSNWAHVLRNLLKAQPAAIFVDILFLSTPAADDAPEGRSILWQVVAEANRKGIPLVFADASAAEPTQRETVRSNLGPDSQLAEISWGQSKESNLYPLSQEGRPTAAAQLFMTLCQGSNVATFCPEQRNQLSLEPANEPHPIYVDWAQSYPDETGILRRLTASLFRTHSTSLSAYHQTYAFDRLLEATSAGERSPREIFGGKAVFVGAALAGIPDVIALPIGAKLPGVYMHAMAFDNLLTYADRYKRRVRPGVYGFHVELWAILMIPFYLAFLPKISSIAERWDHKFHARRSRRRPRRDGHGRSPTAGPDDAAWLIHNTTAVALRFGLAACMLAIAVVPYRLGVAPPDLIGVLIAAELSQQATRILRATLSVIQEVVSPIASATLPILRSQDSDD